MSNRQGENIKKYEYVAENGNGSVYKRHGKPVIVKARSKDVAGKIFGHILGGGDWDVRRAGDEPRIAAIEVYADAHYEIGIIDRQIAELRERREKLVRKAEGAQYDAYQLPDDDVEPFF